MFQKSSCPCHLELGFYTLKLHCDGKIEWPSILNTSLTSRVLWRMQIPASCSPQTPTHFSQKEAVWIWAPEGAWKEIETMTPNKEGTPNPDPSSISCMIYKLVGVVCIPQAHTGRGLSSQILQNPINQDLQAAASMLCSPLAFSEITNISGNFYSSPIAAV